LLALVLDVDFAGWILADEDNREAGGNAVAGLERLYVLGDAGTDFGGDGFAVDDTRMHGTSSSFLISAEL
jgi:hypothetical protein